MSPEIYELGSQNKYNSCEKPSIFVSHYLLPRVVGAEIIQVNAGAMLKATLVLKHSPGN